MSEPARVRVSVVVPVYNPGPFIEPAIASVLAQSLGSDRYEVIFVDDGSTDETPARLDTLAAAHANITVIHTPNSGWAGRPRNLGIDAARGDYVQFLDQDDALAPEALQRLVAMGDRNQSDIVIGKEASDFRGVSVGLFRANRERCTIGDAPLIDSLTPHKMFRTAFLREHRLRFPEGRRRLEDQLFVVQAYFRARTISILADYVCYRYLGRADGGNAGSAYAVPEVYYANAREVMEVVVANTAPGDLRDMLLRRFVRVEMLARLSDGRFAGQPAERQGRMLAAIRELVLDFAGPGVEAGLEPLQQARLQLVRAGDLAGLATLAERTAPIRATVEVRSMTWPGGQLRVRLHCRLDVRGTEPLTILVAGDRRLLHPPLFAGILDPPVDVADAIKRVRVLVTIRDPLTGEDWALQSSTSTILRRPGPAERDATPADGSPVTPADGSPVTPADGSPVTPADGSPVTPADGSPVTPADGGPATPADGSPVTPADGGPVTVEFDVTATLDPLTVAAGRPIPDGRWPLRARIFFAGIDRVTAVMLSQGNRPPVDLPGIAGPEPVVVVPGRDDRGALILGVDRGGAAVSAALAGTGARFAPTDGRGLEGTLRIAATAGTVGIPAVLTVGDGHEIHRTPVRLLPDPAGLRFRARIHLAPGQARTATLGLEVAGDADGALDLGAATIAADGWVVPASAPRVGVARILVSRVSADLWGVRARGSRAIRTARRNGRDRAPGWVLRLGRRALAWRRRRAWRARPQ
jgi:glycosyltransferase involved in cell wall biosynthesis